MRHLWRGVLGGGLAVVMLGAVYISSEIYRHQKIIGEVARYNIAWTLTMAVTEYLRMAFEVSRAPATGDAENAVLRHDIFLSRIVTLHSGDTWAFVSDDAALAAILHRLNATMAEVAPLIGQSDHPDVAARILALLDPHGADLIKLAAATHVYGSARVAQDQAELLRLHWRFSCFVVLLMGCALILIVVLLRRMAELRSTKQRLERNAADLRIALVDADAAGKAKARFLATMSHEVRTPMNAVLALADTLLDDALNPRQREIVETIRRSGDNLLQILNDVLDFSKLDAGFLTLEAVPFAPAALTQEVVRLLSARAEEKGLAITMDFASIVPGTAVGDPVRIRQVLLNLLSNAVKFTEAGSIAVRLRATAHAPGAVSLQWTVSDTGIGIPANRIDSLFTEFVQADNAISQRYGGTGLGLAICKRLIDGMGGTISVESRENAGTTFAVGITLPVAAAPVTEGAGGEDISRTFQDTLARLQRPLRLLFVEDNPTNQFVVRQLLKAFEVELDMAADGQEAIEAAVRASYDVICMDMRMPVLDGPTATRRMRAIGGPLAEVPIIAVTANAFAEDVQACLDAGMDHFVAKPISKETLLRAILHVLTRSLKGAGEKAPMRQAEPPPLTRGEPVLDLAGIAELEDMLGPDGLAEALRVFTGEMQRRLALIATGQLDHEALIREAHSTKGSAGTVGAVGLSRLAAEIEARLKAGGIWQDSDLKALRAAFAAFQEAVGEPRALAS